MCLAICGLPTPFEMTEPVVEASPVVMLGAVVAAPVVAAADVVVTLPVEVDEVAPLSTIPDEAARVMEVRGLKSQTIKSRYVPCHFRQCIR